MRCPSLIATLALIGPGASGAGVDRALLSPTVPPVPPQWV